ncbi:MAG: hypothetical protein L0I29_11215 [Hyphomicrobiales bacterium]|nr:hypothetical protein [Hyphomicrobiales bacterium]
MSDDPETVRQIAELALDDRPLLVLDVDDVVLEFIRPLPRYLASQGLELRLETFHLQGNVFDTTTNEPVAAERVSAAIDAFFAVQAEWQEMTEGAAEALASFGGRAEIVLLTAMPHRHRTARRAHLDRLGLPYPLLTTEMPKGPAIAMLRGEKGRAVAFVDDLPRNLLSARQSVPDAALFHLMADNSVRALLPPFDPQGITSVTNWNEAGPRIAEALGV